MLQMSKLLLNAEFRAASTRVMEEFEKAGVDVKDKVGIQICFDSMFWMRGIRQPWKNFNQ